MANKSAKYETINPLSFRFRTGMWKDCRQNVYTESRCYKTRKYTVCRRVRGSFSPDFLLGLVLWLCCRLFVLSVSLLHGHCFTLPAEQALFLHYSIQCGQSGDYCYNDYDCCSRQCYNQRCSGSGNVSTFTLQQWRTRIPRNFNFNFYHACHVKMYGN